MSYEKITKRLTKVLGYMDSASNEIDIHLIGLAVMELTDIGGIWVWQDNSIEGIWFASSNILFKRSGK